MSEESEGQDVDRALADELYAVFGPVIEGASDRPLPISPLLNAVLAATNSGLTVQSRDFEVIYQNEELTRRFGGVGHPCYRVYEGRDEVCDGCPVARTFETGERHSSDRSFLMPSGKRAYWSNTSLPIRNPSGDIVGAVEITTDVTEQRRAKQDAIDARDTFRDLFYSAGDYVLVLDPAHPELAILDADDAALEHHGYTREELIGQPITLLDDTETAAMLPARRQRANEGAALRFEGRHKRKDGTSFPVEAIGKVVIFGDQPPVLYSIGRDLTERETLEAQLLQSQKLEAVGLLAGGIAHDLNNILTPIIIYTDEVRRSLPEGSMAREDLDEVTAAALRASDLVKQILAIGRRSDPARAPVSLEPLISETARLLRASKPANIDLLIKAAPDCPDVQANATQIHQVLINLGVNALHAMPKGGSLTYSLSAAHRVPSGMDPRRRYLCVAVADTGTGMDATTVARVFDPFFTTKPVGQGTGLGLSVAHGIAIAHEGQLTVSSTVGAGSRFQLYLPVVGDTEVAAHQSDAGKKGLPPIRILLVDDEPAIAKAAARLLRRLGHEVMANTRPEEALELFRHNPENFDCLVTDLMMPTLSGLDLAAEVHQIRADLPILLVTGLGDTVPRDQAAAVGIHNHLDKPFSRESLETALSRAIGDTLARPKPSDG